MTVNPTPPSILFVAVLLPKPLATCLATEQQQLRSLSMPVRWAKPEGFHLTLQYLGRVEGDRRDEIARSLTGVANACAAFQLEIAHLGAFPNLCQPRVLWAGVAGELSSLDLLQRSVVSAMQVLGFQPETRPYQPHITLGRIGRDRLSPDSVRQLSDYLDRRSLQPPVPWPVASIVLVQSLPSNTGIRYRPIAQFPLAASHSPDPQPAEWDRAETDIR